MPKKKTPAQSKKRTTKKASAPKKVKKTTTKTKSRSQSTSTSNNKVNAGSTVSRHSIAPHIIMWLVLALVVFFLLFLFSRIFRDDVGGGRISQEELQIQENRAYLEANVTPVSDEVREIATDFLKGN